MNKSFLRTAAAVLFVALASSLTHAQWTQLDGPHSGPAGFVYRYNGNLYASLTSFTNAKIYRSADAGQQWMYFNGSVPSIGISSAAGTSSALYIISPARDLYISAEGTGAWKVVDSGFINRNIITRLVTSNDSVFAIGSNLSCYIIDTATARWSPRDTGISGVQQVTAAVARNGMIVVATSGKGIMRCGDGGFNWAQSNTGLPRATGGGLVVHGNTLIYGMNTNQAVDSLFASTDNGATWSFLSTAPTHVSAQIASDGSHLYVFAPYVGLWRSDDDGKTWKTIGTDLTTLGIQSISATGDLLALGTSAGPFVSNDLGEHFTFAAVKQPGWFATTQSLVVAPGAVIAGTQSSGAYRSFDRGATWSPADIGFGSTSVTALTLFNGAIYCGAGNVYKTTDNGDSWKRTDTLRTGMPRAVTAIAGVGSTLFVASTNQGVFHSTDNGFTWSADTAGISRKSFTSLNVIDDSIFAGTTTGVFRSTDLGASWSSSNSGMTDTNILSMVSTHGIHIVSTASGIFTSSDGGATWAPTLMFTSIRSLAVVGDTVYAGGDGMYLSTDRGFTWDIDGNDMTSVTVSSLATDGDYLYAGTTTTGVWRRPVSESAGTSAGEAGFSANRVSIYPNPFRGTVNATVTVETDCEARVRMFDILGHVVFDAGILQLTKGSNRIALQPEHIGAGLFFVRFDFPDGRNSIVSVRKQ